MILKLLRTSQWYKNIIIFLAIVFSGNLLNTNLLTLTILGFISLCFISSTNYIINDIIDIKKDRLHPEKKLRPIASGKIKIQNALIIATILCLISILLAFYLSINFFFAVLVLFLLSTFYTLVLKKIILADITTIAVNFVLRAVAGALLINVWISPFLILCPFFLSFFLSTGKRYSNLILLKKKGIYTKKTLKLLINLFLIISILTFAIYCILVNPLLLITIPIVIYVLFRYVLLIFSGSHIARNPELIFKDTKLVISIIIFSIITLLLLYRTIFF